VEAAGAAGREAERRGAGEAAAAARETTSRAEAREGVAASSSTGAGWGTATTFQAILAELIVYGSLLFVGKDLEGFRDLWAEQIRIALVWSEQGGGRGGQLVGSVASNRIYRPPGRRDDPR
jgi:hypothetical protein